MSAWLSDLARAVRSAPESQPSIPDATQNDARSPPRVGQSGDGRQSVGFFGIVVNTSKDFIKSVGDFFAPDAESDRASASASTSSSARLSARSGAGPDRNSQSSNQSVLEYAERPPSENAFEIVSSLSEKTEGLVDSMVHERFRESLRDDVPLKDFDSRSGRLGGDRLSMTPGEAQQIARELEQARQRSAERGSDSSDAGSSVRRNVQSSVSAAAVRSSRSTVATNSRISRQRSAVAVQPGEARGARPDSLSLPNPPVLHAGSLEGLPERLLRLGAAAREPSTASKSASTSTGSFGADNGMPVFLAMAMQNKSATGGFRPRVRTRPAPPPPPPSSHAAAVAAPAEARGKHTSTASRAVEKRKRAKLDSKTSQRTHRSAAGPNAATKRPTSTLASAAQRPGKAALSARSRSAAAKSAAPSSRSAGFRAHKEKRTARPAVPRAPHAPARARLTPALHALDTKRAATAAHARESRRQTGTPPLRNARTKPRQADTRKRGASHRKRANTFSALAQAGNDDGRGTVDAAHESADEVALPASLPTVIKNTSRTEPRADDVVVRDARDGEEAEEDVSDLTILTLAGGVALQAQLVAEKEARAREDRLKRAARDVQRADTDTRASTRGISEILRDRQVKAKSKSHRSSPARSGAINEPAASSGGGSAEDTETCFLCSKTESVSEMHYYGITDQWYCHKCYAESREDESARVLRTVVAAPRGPELKRTASNRAEMDTRLKQLRERLEALHSSTGEILQQIQRDRSHHTHDESEDDADDTVRQIRDAIFTKEVR